MSEGRKAASVLIVSTKSNVADYLRQLLPADRFAPVATAGSAGETLRLMVGQPYDIVIINSPLSDDFGARLAAELTKYESTGIMLLVKSELYEQVAFKTEQYGVVTLAKPADKQLVLQSLNMLAAVHFRLRTLETRAESLQNKMAEIKIINRAKLILVEKLQMSEAEAHRFIEKSAMDRCVKRREIAENIIKTYEN